VTAECPYPPEAQRTEQSVLAYGHEGYAESLAEFGRPLLLRRSGAWLLVRDIPETQSQDAMGVYPFISCHDWRGLPDDMNDLGEALTSVVAVSDPLGHYDETILRRAFCDVVIPFKSHYVANLSARVEEFVHRDHQRRSRNALARLSVMISNDASTLVSEWTDMYENLIKRHNIKGIAAFSEASFKKQARVPGALVLKALDGDKTIGMLWWFVSGDTAYYHLGAFADRGYETDASYALFMTSLKELQQRGVRVACLGGGAGLSDKDSGLSRFKRRWTNAVRTSFLCGRILNPTDYNAVTLALGRSGSSYFPAYRQGERA